MKRSLVGIAALLLTGCATSSKVRASAQVIRADVERARQLGAYACAPRELATAEANLDFAEGDLQAGSSSSAEEHVRLADAAIKKALALSTGCAAKAPKEPRPGKSEEVDTDNDGVPDKDDKCPTEPGLAKNFGCPIADRDGDGIPDDVDQCPDDPEDFDGFQDEDGCPDLDNDLDGVVDAVDRCPNMPGPPDNQGCPKVYQLVVVETDRIQIKQQIQFASGGATIVGPVSDAVLGEVAAALKDNPQIQKVRIEGHTDSTGRPLENQKLSEQRANAVRSALISRGIAPERLEAAGFGATRPIATSSTARGRAENRRTEFRIEP